MQKYHLNPINNKQNLIIQVHFARKRGVRQYDQFIVDVFFVIYMIFYFVLTFKDAAYNICILKKITFPAHP